MRSVYGQELHILLLLRGLLRAPMAVTEMAARAQNLLALHMQQNPQHTVGGWVLRTPYRGTSRGARWIASPA